MAAQSSRVEHLKWLKLKLSMNCGAISGTVKAETRTLKAGDKICLNETIYAAEDGYSAIIT